MEQHQCVALYVLFRLGIAKISFHFISLFHRDLSHPTVCKFIVLYQDYFDLFSYCTSFIVFENVITTTAVLTLMPKFLCYSYSSVADSLTVLFSHVVES